MATFSSDLEERNLSMMERGKGMFYAERKELQDNKPVKKISLLNVEWKMFMAVLAKRISGYSVDC